MSVLTIRNVPDDIHRALKTLAKQHGRSTEAEVRAILATAVKPDQRLRMGDQLWQVGRDIALADEDIDAILAERDRTPATPMRFE